MFIAKTFRAKRIPLDGIVLDADYLHEYQPFRINRERFPDMRRLANTLRGMNIELTASVNPGIAIDDSYEQYKSGLKEDVFLRYADGELWVADIAPNTNHFVDYSDPRGRRWWIDNMKLYQDLGIHGLWNDMNEPAIDGQAMPDNVVFDFDGQKTSALEAQNYYGMLMARAAFESAEQYGGNRRPSCSAARGLRASSATPRSGAATTRPRTSTSCSARCSSTRWDCPACRSRVPTSAAISATATRTCSVVGLKPASSPRICATIAGSTPRPTSPGPTARKSKRSRRPTSDSGTN